jgi:2-furoate---CoA ligase
VAPLNWRIKPEELDYCLADADAAAIVFDDVAADTVAGAAVAQRVPRIAIGKIDGAVIFIWTLLKPLEGRFS